MNEQEKKMARAAAEAITKQLANEGRLIEGGWRALMILCKLETAPEVQKQEMKRAYYAGAQHLFSSIVNIMDEDREPTAGDLHKMDLIHSELEKWAEEQRALRWS